MTDLEKAQKSIWKIYKEYCLECKKLETPYEAGLDGFKNYKEKKELTSKMLSDVNNIKKKYNIENLEISAKDLFEFEKKLFEKEKRMFWRLSEDLINKKNYDEVNKLLDFIFNDIETVLIKDGKEINLSKIEKEKALKRIEEIGEIKVVENYKAGKYKPI
ncbi:hypothetical protein [Fusobacterium pseudoperiodonticum]|nr:hypothetical protein [Fusobacterium pseudoperiodonticum]